MYGYNLYENLEKKYNDVEQYTVDVEGLFKDWILFQQLVKT